MGRYGDNVALQEIHVGKNGIVHPLKDIGPGAVSGDFIGVIDNAVSERLYFLHFALDGKTVGYIFEIHIDNMVFANIAK